MSPVSFSFKTTILVSVLASSLPLFAQNGAIQGRIVDPASAVLANCRSRLSIDAKAVVFREPMSGTEGPFQLHPLPPVWAGREKRRQRWLWSGSYGRGVFRKR